MVAQFLEVVSFLNVYLFGKNSPSATTGLLCITGEYLGTIPT